MRQAEILRMSKEGLSMAQIKENLESRGVTFKRGHFKRICTNLGLDPDPQDSVKAIRHHYYNQAHTQQKHEFENIAAELGIQDVESWTKSKMDEECFIIARRERAHKLMGDLRPSHPYPAKRKSRSQATRAESDHAGTPGEQQEASSQTVTPPGSREAEGPIEISDDDTDMEGQGDDDCEGSDDERAQIENIQPGPSTVGFQTDLPEPSPSQPSSHDAERDPGLQSTAPRTEQASDNPQGGQAAPYQYLGHTFTTAPSIPNVVPGPHFGAGSNTKERLAGPTGIGRGHPTPSQQQPQQVQYPHVSPGASVSFQPLSQRRVKPQQPCAPKTGHRPIAPRPVSTEAVFQPSPPPISGVTIPLGEAEMMATYGLYPVPTSKTTTQRFQTPNGLVRTNGYEYLPLAWIRRSQLEFPPAGEMTLQQQQSQQSPQPQHQSPIQLTLSNPAPPGPPNPIQTQAAMVPASSLPRPSAKPAEPQAVTRKDAATQTPTPDPVHPPSLPKSKVPAPPLNIPPEEATRHKASYEIVLKHQKAALEFMQYLTARAEAKPLSESLTGLPPSLKDVETAKARLRESAETLLASLE